MSHYDHYHEEPNQRMPSHVHRLLRHDRCHCHRRPDLVAQFQDSDGIIKPERRATMKAPLKASQIPANLPQRIQDADAAIWRDWMNSRNVSTLDSKRVYVRQLSTFYGYTEEPIMATDETGIHNYEQHLRESGKSAATIAHDVRTAKSYWTFARQHQAESEATA